MAAVQCHLSYLGIMSGWSAAVAKTEKPAALSAPVWKGYSSLCPASPSIKVEAAIVKVARFS